MRSKIFMLTIGLAVMCAAITVPETYAPHAIDFDRIFNASLIVSIPLYAAICLILWVTARGFRHRLWIAIGCSAVLFFPFFDASEKATEAVNREFDNSGPQTHRAVLRVKDFGKNPHFPIYFCWLESWRQPGKLVYLPNIGRTMYDRAIPQKSIVRVTSRAGALGFEWVESFALEDDAPQSAAVTADGEGKVAWSRQGQALQTVGWLLLAALLGLIMFRLDWMAYILLRFAKKQGGTRAPDQVVIDEVKK